MRIILPPFPGWDQVSNLKSTDCYLFASRSDPNKAIIPPGWLKSLKGNVNNIWAGEPRANKKKSGVLSPAGKTWLRANARLWPFLDRTQRQDGYAFSKYDLSNLTDAQLLEYAHFFYRAFGTGHGGNQQFVEAGRKGFEKECIRRTRVAANKNPELGEFPEFATFDDVIKYLSSDKMKEAFNNGKKNRVFTYIYWILEAVSNETGNEWLDDCLQAYFEEHDMLVELGVTINFPAVDRHSLLCWMNNKGGDLVKKRARTMMTASYSRKLIVKTAVHSESKKHEDLMNTGKFEVVLVDRQYVPSSRMKSPAYYLEILKVDTSPIVEHELRKAAESAAFGDMPYEEFMQMAGRVFNNLLVEHLEEPTYDQGRELQVLENQRRTIRGATRLHAERDSETEREQERDSVFAAQLRQNSEEARRTALAEHLARQAAEAESAREREAEARRTAEAERAREREREAEEARERESEERRAAEAQRAREREREAEEAREREREAEEAREREAQARRAAEAQMQRARERE
ncbi:hypothetical protein THAOC_17996, partial [Thalassiosira oceanica]